jgi:hypothetical protein
MTKFPMTVLAVIALANTALAMAADQPTNSKAKPTSFVPHPHASHHIYGTPIQPAVVGHAKTSHHKHTRKKTPSRTNRDGS